MSPGTSVVVMGVAGSGKSTVGRALAHRLTVPFLEGDDFHPPANVEKMRRGMPLNDDDRDPWLRALAAAIASTRTEHGGVVLSCSALKRHYRDVLRTGDPGLRFVQLTLTPQQAAERVAGRAGHFMPETLVTSQFATLEPLQDPEPGITLDATRAVDDTVSAALRYLAGPRR